MIGILSGIVILSYGSVQKGVVNTQVSTDLNGVKVAMQTARANAGGYPTSIPSSFSASADVTVSYVSGDAKGYCIEASTTRSSGARYYLNTTDATTPKEGSCPSVVTPISNVAVDGNTATVTWAPQSGATSYTVQYRRNGGAWTSVSSTASPRVISGLELSSTYEFQLRTVKSSSTSSWSDTVSRVTLPEINPTHTYHSCGASQPESDYGDGWINVTLSLPAVSKTYISTYVLEGEPGEVYANSPKSIPNSTGTSTITTLVSSTYFQRGSQGGDGTITIYGIGPNGERSVVNEYRVALPQGAYC